MTANKNRLINFGRKHLNRNAPADLADEKNYNYGIAIRSFVFATTMILIYAPIVIFILNAFGYWPLIQDEFITETFVFIGAMFTGGVTLMHRTIDVFRKAENITVE